MPATVEMLDVLREIHGLSGLWPSISVKRGSGLFIANTNLVRVDKRRGNSAYVTAESDSADLALLKAYESLFTLAPNEYLSGSQNGKQWVYDPPSEGWIQDPDQ